MKPVALLAAVFAALILAADSCSSSSPSGSSSGSATPSAPAKIYAVGQTMTNGAHQTVTVSAYKGDSPPADPTFATPAAGNKCVAITAALFNGDSSPWTLPTSEFAIVDANGQTHNDYGSFACGNSSTIDSLVPNGKATANLFFEVPATGTLMFQWTPNALNANSTYDTKLQ